MEPDSGIDRLGVVYAFLGVRLGRKLEKMAERQESEFVMKFQIESFDADSFKNYLNKNRDKFWKIVRSDLNEIGGGRKMEKPKNGGITTLAFTEIKEDKNTQSILIRIKKVLSDAEEEILKLENQNVLLAKEIVRIRRRDNQIAELMGLKK